MSRKTLIIVAVIVLAALAAGLYYWHQKEQVASAPVLDESAATLPSGTSTSDASLTQDTAAIDAEFKGMDADNASAEENVQ